MVLGGILALYIRFLYRRCNTSFSGSDSVARIFPLLTIVMIAVIATVKSSLALSLGLVGALSIVRFRAAIKEPEELVYLFLCIGVGLALGAEQPLLALALVIVATVYVLGIHFTTGKSRRQNLLLTITGDSKEQFTDGEEGVQAVVAELIDRYTLQRLDLEQERGQMRIAISRRLQFTYRSAKIETPRIEFADGKMRVSLTPACSILRGVMGCRRKRLKCV